MSNCRLGISGAAAFLLLILSALSAKGQADSVLTAHRQALSRLQAMLDGREALSFERAVFITENAWHGGTLDSAAFDLTLRSMAALVERAGRSVPVRNEEHERPLAIQYALYQLLKDTLKVATPQGVFRTAPYTYNIDDFDGRRDWSGQFVTRLVEEGRGTCRSLPYLYQILSERLGVESWLAFAPSHVYVKHRDAGRRSEGWQQRMHNVELTNGSFPTDGWLMASGYITLKAIQHGLFMRKLEAREAVAQCAVDLAGGYARKTGRLTDGFAASCAALALSVDTLNPNARLLEIRVARAVWEASGKKADLAKLEGLCRRLAALGYREMPAQMYLNWLFELRTAKNPLDSVRYRPKRFPKPDSLNGLPVLTLTDGYFDEFPDWADSTRMAGVVFDLKKKQIVCVVREPDSLRRGESWLPSRWLSTDPIHHPYQSPYAAFDGNPIFFVDPNGTSVGDYYTRKGDYLGSDGIDDDKVYVVDPRPDYVYGGPDDIAVFESECFRLEHGLDRFAKLSGSQSNNIVSHLRQFEGSLYEISELSITHTEFMARIRWVYGEGGGEAADYYAHAIHNGFSIGWDAQNPKPFKSWQQRFRAGMGKSYSSFIDGTYEGEVSNGKFYPNSNYIKTNPYVNDPEGLNNIAGVRLATAAIIRQLSGYSDPTNGSYSWFGAPNAKDKDKIEASLTDPVSVRGKSGRYHIFYKR